MVTKKTSSTTKAETATVKAEKKETAAAKAIGNGLMISTVGKPQKTSQGPIVGSL